MSESVNKVKSKKMKPQKVLKIFLNMCRNLKKSVTDEMNKAQNMLKKKILKQY